MKALKRKKCEKLVGGKKMKQTTLIEILKRNPRVVVTPLRMPLENLPIYPEKKEETNQSDIEIIGYVKAPVKNKLLKNFKSKTVKSVNKQVELSADYLSFPSPSLVPLPPGFKNEHFGDGLLVSEFTRNFHGVLQIVKCQQLSAGTLLKLISHGVDGFGPVNGILLHLVKAIVKDIEKTELGVLLSNISITGYSASEVARLCLKHCSNYQKVNVLSSLNLKEIFELPPSDVIETLSELCLLALQSSVVGDYVNKNESYLRKLNLKRIELSNLEAKLNPKLVIQDNTNEKQTEVNGSLTPITFYGPTFVEASQEIYTESLTPLSQRKIMTAKMRAEGLKLELKRQEKIKEEKELLNVQVKIQKLESNQKTIKAEMIQMKRKTPLGTDRNGVRYWWFSDNSPSLILEKPGKFHTNDSEMAPLASEWYHYESEEQLRKLIKALSNGNENDRRLELALRNILSDFVTSCTLKDDEPIKDSDWIEKSIMYLKNNMRRAMGTIINKALGWMNDQSSWNDRLADAENTEQLRKLLVEIGECLNPSSLLKTVGTDDTLAEWITAVQECSTLSRLHLLFEILKFRVNWSDAKASICKVCQRKRTLLLICCSGCHSNYHLECVRPPLLEAPEKNWQCSSCNDLNKIQESLASTNSNSNSDDECSSAEEEITLKCKQCKRPGTDLIECSKCKGAYHLKCYKPKLRYPPRGTWICGKCKKDETDCSLFEPKKRKPIKPKRKEIKLSRELRSRRLR